MPGRSKAPKSGSLLKDKVVKLARQLGLRVETEVKAARRIWGQRRYIDVVLIDDRTGKRLGIECKFQATLGTAEEKIPATIQDIAHWPIPGLVVIDGVSENMKGYLLSTGKVVLFSELEEWLRLYFGL